MSSIVTKGGVLNYLKLLSISILSLTIFNFVIAPLLTPDPNKTTGEEKVEELAEEPTAPVDRPNTIGIEEANDQSARIPIGVPETAPPESAGKFSLRSFLNLPNAEGKSPRGFFSGLWHGFIVIYMFIASLFVDNIMFDMNNTGTPYWIGFGIGFLLIMIISSQD